MICENCGMLTKPFNDGSCEFCGQSVTKPSNNLKNFQPHDNRGDSGGVESDRAKEVEAIKQKLAAIEHERWSDWMEYMFDCAVRSGSDVINIRTCGWPTAQFESWQRQIETDYEDLSTKEQASDIEQVDRYWPLIDDLIRRAEVEARLSEMLKWRTMIQRMAAYMDGKESLEEYDERINELREEQ